MGSQLGLQNILWLIADGIKSALSGFVSNLVTFSTLVNRMNDERTSYDVEHKC